MVNSKKHAVMISDIMTDEHALITRRDLDIIKSGLLSLQRDFYELGSPELERDVMKLWHKVNDMTKDIEKQERRHNNVLSDD